MGQQIVDGDRTFRWNGDASCLLDGCLFERRDEVAHRFIDRDLAFFNEY
jgi:hypothetical protein